MRTVELSPPISYLPASEEPLSADVGIISLENVTWIFDVGSNDESAELINSVQGEKRIVLSHFHADHITNISRIKCDKIYCGSFTRKKLGDIKDTEIITVESDLYFDKDGVRLFPLPSSHAKSCVALEYGDFAFLGDGTYCTKREGKYVYNSGQLQALIAVLKSLKANRLLLSHNEPFASGREDVIAQLEKIYSLRKKELSYITVNCWE